MYKGRSSFSVLYKPHQLCNILQIYLYFCCSSRNYYCCISERILEFLLCIYSFCFVFSYVTAAFQVAASFSFIRQNCSCWCVFENFALFYITHAFFFQNLISKFNTNDFHCFSLALLLLFCCFCL